MERQTFVLTGVEHRGTNGDRARFVCYVKGEPGTLAVWGTIGDDMRHIHALDKASARDGWPVTVECEWIRPNPEIAERFGHQFWVPEGAYFEILPSL